MKLLRVLLIAAFVLAAFTTTTAQASTNMVGFVPLISNPDPDIPVLIQSENALHLLLPGLLEARRTGQLLEVQPSLAGGVLRLVYRPGFDLTPMLMGRPVFAELDQALAAVAAPKPAVSRDGGHVSVGAGTALFQMTMNDSYVSASGLTAGALVRGTIRSQSGRLLGVLETYADAAGDLSGVFQGVSGFAYFHPGAVVKFREYSGATLLSTYQVVVPALKFNGVNKAEGVVTGNALPNRNFTAQWWHDKWDAGKNTLTVTKSGQSNSLGKWRVDFGSVVLHGRDRLYVKLQINSHFSFDTGMTIPYLDCQVGGNICIFVTFPGKPSTLTILNNGITYTFEQSFLRGLIIGQLLTPAGQPIALIPGAVITGTGASPLTLPAITASINYATDVISGKTLPNKYFNATLYDASNSNSYPGYLHSDAAGSYSGDLSIFVNLVPTHAYWGYLSVVNPSTGNVVSYSKAFSP